MDRLSLIFVSTLSKDIVYVVLYDFIGHAADMKYLPNLWV